MRPLPATCSEQGKLPAAKAFTLAERDKHMSEQKINYMAELDAWTESNVLAPLLWTGEEGKSEDLSDDTLERVKHDIREKVLGELQERPAQRCRRGQEGAEVCSSENSLTWHWCW